MALPELVLVRPINTDYVTGTLKKLMILSILGLIVPTLQRFLQYLHAATGKRTHLTKEEKML